MWELHPRDWQSRQRLQTHIAAMESVSMRQRMKVDYFCGIGVSDSSGRTPRAQEQAIDYAQGRACFRSGEIRSLKSNGAVERIIPLNEGGSKTVAARYRLDFGVTFHFDR